MRTQKVYGYLDNGMPKIENSLVKLEDERAFPNFIQHINANKYKENPVVEKVVEYSGEEKKEVDVTAWQNIINDAIKNDKKKSPIDYKVKSEAQQREIESQKLLINSFEERIASLEKGKPISKEQLTAEVEMSEGDFLRIKAKQLGIKFRENIGNEKLMAKIIEVEPEFTL